jgi:hypothetical protein
VQAFILLGNETDPKLYVCKKALAKVVQPFKEVGIVIPVNVKQALHIEDILVILFCALFGNVKLVSCQQLENALDKSFIVQPDDIVILPMELQLENVEFNDILAPTAVGNDTDCKLMQLEKQLTIVVKLVIVVGRVADTKE